MPTLIPMEELRGSPPRAVCPYEVCKGKFRYWDWASGVEASILGRYVVVKCRTCGGKACIPQ